LANVRSSASLSAVQARRVALAAQGFADGRPSGRVDVRHVRRALDHVGVVQIDSVNVLCRSHELPLWSRIGQHPRGALEDLAHGRRELFEYWGHAASFLPVRFHPALRWRMGRARAEAWSHVRGLERERPGYVEEVRADVEARGPLAASELTDGGSSQGPWWGWAAGKTALEWLFWCGIVTAAGRRRSFERVYDLAERVLPASVLDAPALSQEDAHRLLLAESARWLGVGTARDIADYFRILVPEARPRLAELVEAGELLAVDVEGWTQPAYLHPAARIPRRVDARAVLSPFDSLVWERDRTERIFGMRVVLEVYTPAPKRQWGYYVLPFLLGDELVGRVDLKADRKAGALVAQAAWVEPAHAARAAEVADALTTELEGLAAFLGLERVTSAGRGDLPLLGA
jgi:uncharacterized protein YcaQ